MTVIVFSGLPATGKSTLSKNLVKILENVKLLSTDVLRRKVLKHYFDSDLNNLLYEDRNVETVYNVIHLMVEELINFFEWIVIDATYHKKNRRKNLIRLMKKLDANFLFVITKATDKIIKNRMIERSEHNNTLSDARYEQYLLLKKEWQSYDMMDVNYLEVDTSESIENNIEQILNYFRI